MKTKLLSLLLSLSILFSLLPSAALAAELPINASPAQSGTVWEGSALAYVENPYGTTPRPIDGVQLYQNIPAEAVERSLELYNNVLSADPNLFLVTEKGLKAFDFQDEQTDAEINYVRQKTAEIVAGCTTTDEQIFAVASYLARNICYDYDYLADKSRGTNLSAYDVLVNEYTVCAGYALSFALMMQMLGHPCIYVVTLNGNHAWNLVHNGERWMMVDATWMSSSSRNNGINMKSDEFSLLWYDFTIEQANADYSHVLERTGLTIADGVLSDFPRYSVLTSYEIPSHVTSIGDWAFYGSPNTLYIPKSLTSLGYASFYQDPPKQIYYEGTSTEFSKISKGSFNDEFFRASITYNAYTPSPWITSHPTGGYTGVSTPITLSVSAVSSAPLTYQWYVNTVPSNEGCTPVAGATEATFAPPVSTTGTLYYCVVVSSGSSYAISQPVEVTVYPTAPESRIRLANGFFATLFSDLDEVWLEGNGALTADQLTAGRVEGYATIRIGAGITGLPDHLSNSTLFQNATNYVVDPANPVYTNDEYGVLINKVENQLLEYPCRAEAESYSISEGIVSVAPGAFNECWNLSSLHIPASLRSLPDLDQYISSVTIAEGNPVFYFDDYNVLINSAEHHIVKSFNEYNLTTYTVDSSIKSIGDYAFSGHWRLESLTLPEGLTAIGDRAFCYCSSLTSVTLPDSLTLLSEWAFSSCASLTDVTIGNGVTHIGNLAFSWCESLSNVTIGSGVTHIGSQAFDGCENLKAVYFTGNAPSIKHYAFPEDIVFYYPSTASGWTTPTYGGYAAYPYTVLNGLVMDEYGIWWYYEDNKVQTDYTGLIYFNDAFFYVENGMLNAGYSGLVEYYGNLYYVECGVLKWDYTGLVYWGDLFYYVENGTVNWSYTGLVYLAGEFYYVENGILAQGYTGLIFFADVFYYVECGRINFSYTGLVYCGDLFYYVENGILNFGYTGLVYCGDAFYYVENGVLNFGYTGLVYFADVFYYVENGVLNFGYTGLIYCGDAFYYVENGILNWNYTGLVWFYDAWYYVNTGVLDFSYSGPAYTPDGTQYNVIGGIAQP